MDFAELECPDCGTEVRAERPDRTVPCERCTTEFYYDWRTGHVSRF